MNNTELDMILSNGVLKWNFVENITDILEKDNGMKKDDEKKSVLEEIFPPRVWTRINSKNKVITMRQTISKELSTRDSVSELIVALNHLEKFYRFKKKGICETRNTVHNLFFDEVLRQVVILDEDLGGILYRIQNEYKNMIYILKCLFDKAMISNNLCLDSSTDITKLFKEVEDLTKINNDLKLKCKYSEQRYQERLKKKESGKDYKFLVALKLRYKIQRTMIKASTEQLKEQMNIMAPATKTSYLIQSKVNPTKM